MSGPYKIMLSEDAKKLKAAIITKKADVCRKDRNIETTKREYIRKKYKPKPKKKPTKRKI